MSSGSVKKSMTFESHRNASSAAFFRMPVLRLLKVCYRWVSTDEAWVRSYLLCGPVVLLIYIEFLPTHMVCFTLASLKNSILGEF